MKENTAVITELNTTMRTLNSVISELKIDYKSADEKLATHLKEHDKTLQDYETRITVIEGRT